MSAAQRQAVSERMKRYWAARRQEAGAGTAEGETAGEAKSPAAKPAKRRRARRARKQARKK
jgi:hypothetical protein